MDHLVKKDDYDIVVYTGYIEDEAEMISKANVGYRSFSDKVEILWDESRHLQNQDNPSRVWLFDRVAALVSLLEVPRGPEPFRSGVLRLVAARP